MVDSNVAVASGHGMLGSALQATDVLNRDGEGSDGDGNDDRLAVLGLGHAGYPSPFSGLPL
eukprot:9740432-Heterocapsa_arctica.AAC.1